MGKHDGCDRRPRRPGLWSLETWREGAWTRRLLRWQVLGRHALSAGETEPGDEGETPWN